MDVSALEEAAKAVLTRSAYDYYAGGADDEITLADNVAAWHRVRFLPHVLTDVSAVTTGTTLLGTPLETPILIAPMAAQRLAHPDGERAMARVAAGTGSIMVVSTMATVSLEDVAAEVPRAPLWFQCYVHRDRAFSESLLRRAAAAGYRAVVLTVDLQVVSRRRRDERNHFELPDGVRMENVDVSMKSLHGSALAEYSNVAFDPALTPDDIGWIASVTGLPVIVKGVLRADDAVRATDAGAAAVIVSNHGGRQLDGAVASADALPAVVDAVGDRVPVLVDGGIRGGYDVVKALAIGARAVLVGRPFLWGLAVGGYEGAAAVMAELTGEVRRSLTLAGLTSPAAADRSLLA